VTVVLRELPQAESPVTARFPDGLAQDLRRAHFLIAAADQLVPRRFFEPATQRQPCRVPERDAGRLVLQVEESLRARHVYDRLGPTCSSPRDESARKSGGVADEGRKSEPEIAEPPSIRAGSRVLVIAGFCSD
jgi:hypothetical protein